MTIACSHEARRVALVICQVNLGTLAQQKGDDFGLVANRCREECAVALGAFRVDVGAVLQQERRYSQVALGGRDHEGGHSLVVYLVNLGSFSEQESNDLEVVPLRCQVKRASTGIVSQVDLGPVSQ